MKKSAPLILSLFASLLLSTTLLTPATGAEFELLNNGGFEQAEANKLPEGWTLNGVGAAEVSADAHSGNRALRVTFGHEATGCYTTKIPVRKQVEYHASYWTKGTGTVQLVLYQYSESGLFLYSKFCDARSVNQNWQRFQETFQVTDKNVTQICFALHVLGAGTSAVFDDASFTYDAEKYPPPVIENPETKVTLRLEIKNATVNLFLDEKEISIKNDEATFRLQEGIHILSLIAKATGDSPAVRITCKEHPYLQTAFRSHTLPTPGWQQIGFDDSSWLRPSIVAESDRTKRDIATNAKTSSQSAIPEQGWMWPEGNSQAAVFRQVIGYAHTFHGPQRCISPRVKQWEWPQTAMQVINLWLRPLDEKSKIRDFRFILDVPKVFRLLDTQTRCVNWFSMITPVKVLETSLTREGLAYTRYEVMYPANFHTEQPMGCYSALCLKPENKVLSKQVNFYYRRLPSVNQVELEVTVPVQMLPSVNGIMPKRIMQWSPIPPVEDSGGISSKEEALESARLHAAMGINIWVARPDPFARSKERKDRWDEALREFIRLGGKYGIWMWNSIGLNYGFADYMAPGPTRYLKEHPEIQARWYNGENPKTYGENVFNYCNEWAGSQESAPFWEEIRKTYAMSLVDWPKPEFLFFDWEYARIDQQGKGNHCFCNRCKKAFRDFAKLSDDLALEDETIVRKYSSQWSMFRCYQDARLYAQIKRCCNALGQKMMMYVAGGDLDPIKYAKGCLDIFHEGCPGNGYARSSSLDSLTAHFDGSRTTLGEIPILPQMLPSFPNNGLQTEPSLDGYYHPKQLAVTNLVGTLATRGGGMEHWIVPAAYTAGGPFYLGESNRLLATCEDFFKQGERHDELVTSSSKCGKVAVLTLGKERLILAFNDEEALQRVTLIQKKVSTGTKARLFLENKMLPDPAKMVITIPGEYFSAVLVR